MKQLTVYPSLRLSTTSPPRTLLMGGVVYGLNVRDGTSAHTVTAAYDAIKGNNLTPAFYPRTAVLIEYK